MNNSPSSAAWPPGFAIHTRSIIPEPEMIAGFKGVATSHVSDCMGRTVGSIGLKALHGKDLMCGPAFTVRVRPGDNLMIHKAIELASAGDVLVVDGAGDMTQALLGGLMRSNMIHRGLSGLVVNGVVRDLAEWQEGGFPVFALGTTHRGPSKDGPGEINVPVNCAGLVVFPGDLMLGDLDGVVAVPPGELRRLLPLVRVQAVKEAKLRAAIKNGTLKAGRYDDVLLAKGCPIIAANE